MLKKQGLYGVGLLICLFCLLTFGLAEGSYPFCEVSFSGKTDFIYSDSMLLADGRTLSPDIAKASVAMADAAYRWGEVSSALSQMDFTIVAGGGSTYSSRTYSDNDRVGYTITKKPIDGYTVYCIPVRGTGGNAEWFSDFRLGENNGGVHQGFQIAASELYSDLISCFSAGENRIVWICGHSRGAAVSNMVAGWLVRDGYVSEEHLFSYNFACPAIAKDVSNYGGIYNFNNAGDLITLMPLAAWGYGRNGRTITKTLRGESNIESQFARMYGESLQCASNGNSYINMLRTLAPQEADFHTPIIQLGLELLCLALDDAHDVSMLEILAHYAADLPGIVFQLKDAVGSITNPGVSQLIGYVNSVAELNVEMLTFIDSNKSDVSAMDEAAFAAFLQQNSDMIRKIENKANLTIATPADFALSATSIGSLSAAATTLMDVLRLYLDTGTANPMTMVWHGHTPESYIAWINSEYYGYRGWYGSGIVSVTVPGSMGTVGKECFSGCGQLAGIEIQEGVRYIGASAFLNCRSAVALILPDSLEKAGNGAFNGCSSLISVTMPVDLQQGEKLFDGCKTVQHIHYLKGKTGIMRDRRSGTGYNNFDYFLESNCWQTLQSIDFAEGVLRIGDYAYYCYNFDTNSSGVVNTALTSVTLPSTLESIGSYAFYRHWGVTDVALPESLTSLGVYCFYDTRLTSAAIAEGVTEIPEYCFYGNGAMTKLSLPETLKTIGRYAFAGCYSLETLVIPEMIDLVDCQAFSGCSGLKEVTMPVDLQQGTILFDGCTNVQQIHYLKGKTGVMCDRTVMGGAIRDVSDFLECKSFNTLRQVDFAEGITRIGSNAYNYDKNVGTYSVLTSVTLPSTLESIGDSAFYCQSGITDTTLPESLTSLGAYSFYYTSLSSVTIPEGVTEIPEYCFYGNSTMAELSLPETIETIGRYAFAGCRALETLVIPEMIDRVDAQAFSGCSGLKEVTMPVDVENRDQEIFRDCCNVEIIHYLEGKTGVMGDRSVSAGTSRYVTRFLECKSSNTLRQVDFAEGVTRIGSNAYNYNKDGVTFRVLTLVTLPSTLQSIGSGAFYKQEGITDITLPEGLTGLGAYCFYYTSLSSLTIPEGVTEIPEYCFYGNSTMAELTLPEALETIGQYAFAGCRSLETLVIPEMINRVDAHAFDSCSGLKEVTMPVDLQQGTSLFSGCRNVQTIHYLKGKTGVMRNHSEVPGSSSGYTYFLENVAWQTLQSIDFAEGITRIGEYAYYCYDPEHNSHGVQNTSLTSVTLPSTLESVGKYAFYYHSGLTEMTLPASLAEIGDFCFAKCGLTRISFLGDPPAIAANAFSNVTATAVCAFGNEAWTLDAMQNYGGNLTWKVHRLNGFRLPDLLTQIGDEAFMGFGADAVILGDRVTSIGVRSFANCASLRMIWIPASVTQIDKTAFSDSNVTICTTRGSYAWQFAQNNRINVVAMEFDE